MYSLHKSSTRAYLERHALHVLRAASATVLAELRYELPRVYAHHRKDSVTIEVDLWRFEPPADGVVGGGGEGAEGAEGAESAEDSSADVDVGVEERQRRARIEPVRGRAEQVRRRGDRVGQAPGAGGSARDGRDGSARGGGGGAGRAGRRGKGRGGTTGTGRRGRRPARRDSVIRRVFRWLESNITPNGKCRRPRIPDAIDPSQKSSRET